MTGDQTRAVAGTSIPGCERCGATRESSRFCKPCGVNFSPNELR